MIPSKIPTFFVPWDGAYFAVPPTRVPAVPADELSVCWTGPRSRVFAGTGGHLDAPVPAMGKCGKSSIVLCFYHAFSALPAREAAAAGALDFMILTAARTGLSPRRSFGGESIFQAKVWVVPPSRMNLAANPVCRYRGRSFRCSRCKPIIKTMVFPDDRRGKPLSNTAMSSAHGRAR